MLQQYVKVYFFTVIIANISQGIAPVSLAEYALKGGSDGVQAFYDISLVDGYNIPIGIVFLPGDDPKLQKIPPNLTNAVCIASAGYASDPAPSGTNGMSSNATYPIPYEPSQTNMDLSSWCPWDYLVIKPDKPGDGVYPYPDDNIQRPVFDPCKSACIATNAPEDCCTGAFSDRSKCTGNLYSKASKQVCPDAYAFPFDDETSTFIIPAGGGFETIFCPEGRSTNILKTFMQQLQDLSAAGNTKSMDVIDQDARNMSLILEGAKMSGAERRLGEGVRMGKTSVFAMVVVVAWAVLW